MSNKNNILELYLEYVCPKCFNTLDKCQCDSKSYSLINIDRNLQEHIRILKRKGYSTLNCCEGHYNNVNTIYIQFAKEYGFGDKIVLPYNFRYVKSHRIIEYKYSKTLSVELFEKVKTEQLNILLDWCNNLSDICNKH